jgi:hypothetical protein
LNSFVSSVSQFQRREDDAMADSFISRSGCYTTLWDTTREGSNLRYPADPRLPRDGGRPLGSRSASGSVGAMGAHSIVVDGVARFSE